MIEDACEWKVVSTCLFLIAQDADNVSVERAQRLDATISRTSLLNVLSSALARSVVMFVFDATTKPSMS
jgi:hypothetical protein